MDLKACLICGDTSNKTLPYPSSNSNFKYFKINGICECLKCGFGRAVPVPTVSQLNKFYTDGSYWGGNSSSNQLIVHNRIQSFYRIDHILKFLRKEKTSLNVLDVGAGTGALGWSLQKFRQFKLAKYNIIESDDNMIRYISSHVTSNTLNVIDGNNIPSNSFDIIFLNHVLEHVIDPIQFVKKFVPALTEGGKIYIEVPNKDHLFKSDVFPHTLFFEENVLKLLAQKCKLKVLESRTFGNQEAGRTTTNSPLLALYRRFYSASLKLNRFTICRFLNNLIFRYNSIGSLWTSVVLEKETT